MGWQWSADPRDRYADHLTGRCGCSDDAPACARGRATYPLVRTVYRIPGASPNAAQSSSESFCVILQRPSVVGAS